MSSVATYLTEGQHDSEGVLPSLSYILFSLLFPLAFRPVPLQMRLGLLGQAFNNHKLMRIGSWDLQVDLFSALILIEALLLEVWAQGRYVTSMRSQNILQLKTWFTTTTLIS